MRAVDLPPTDPDRPDHVLGSLKMKLGSRMNYYESPRPWAGGAPVCKVKSRGRREFNWGAVSYDPPDTGV
jgi:hypothetical protein